MYAIYHPGHFPIGCSLSDPHYQLISHHWYISYSLQRGRITPLLKKPTLNPALLENYRPVSLLPFVAKTLERFVCNQLSSFLAQNNLLDSNQSGFKSGHSTETALLSVIEALRLERASYN
ncbi:MAG: reverse transcriptase domain-containing protein, partial [Plesiomonas shigelloides]